ncbi:sulfite exporter TauE/SafE family protein [Mycolicibacterium sp. 050158]|uniref:sulfite exporter TauE/SafE family protein n=1 Tax=Mycolicibacterium sp. 050158 TaxID=3090602 RepID=UPI00299E09A7|nr:sulfite exporter TauE/SafE family protein [Mycolicibacterium sp. 050158]MDX1890323.1 sulfite exporter TauE/SafE family protein [Mycolicibacterium sp. 050158]
MITLTIALAVLVGVALGLLGGGGSILTVPLLTYVAGLEARHAIASSLLVVGVTSAMAAITHARAGRVQWRIAALFGLTAMAGAYGGGRVAHVIPGTALLVAFAIIMVAAGLAMLRSRPEPAESGEHPLPTVRIALLGAAVGLISGLVGAGGGFLLVPALTLLAGLPMPIAVGTSLVVISMQSLAGLAGHLASEQIDWRLAGFVTAAAVVGALIGGRLVPLIDPGTLRRAFGWFVLLMASVILAQELDPAVGATLRALTLGAAAASFACTRYAHCPLQRLLGASRPYPARTI